MKRYKYCFLVGFAVLFAFTACMQIPQSSEASSIPAVSSQASSAASSVPAVSSEVSGESSSIPAVWSPVCVAEYILDYSSKPSVPSGSPYTLDEYKAILKPYLAKNEFIIYVEAYIIHPSPDGKNQYIEVVVCIGNVDDDWENYESYLFLNDFDHFVKNYLYEFLETVEWIDNKRALIDQGTIVDIETGKEKNIMDNSFFDHFESGYIVESDVNAAGTQIATFNRRHFDGENGLGSMQYVYLYDIAEDQWQLLYETPYLYEDTSDPHAFIKWKTDDCLEFYLHYGAKFNYTISSGKIVEVPNFVVKDDDVFNAERLKKDYGFAGEQTIYMFDPDLINWNLYTYMKEYNLKIAPGSYYIHSKDTYSDLMKKLIFVPNK